MSTFNFRIFDIALFLLGIVVLGEVIVRIDEIWDRDGLKDVVALEARTRFDNDYRSDGSKEGSLSVLVLGDSYVFGAGLKREDTLVQVLGQKLEHHSCSDGRSVHLSDRSMPSANLADVSRLLTAALDSAEYDQVVYGYNINDIEGSLNLKNGGDDLIESGAKMGNKPSNVIDWVYNIVYASHLAHRVLHGLHSWLNHQGILLPMSKAYLTNKWYEENGDPWRKGKELIIEMDAKVGDSGSSLVIFTMPFFNLLEQENLFRRVDDEIISTRNELRNTAFLSGWDAFGGYSSDAFQISRQDSHPNADAVELIADQLMRFIFRNGCLSQ